MRGLGRLWDNNRCMKTGHRRLTWSDIDTGWEMVWR